MSAHEFCSSLFNPNVQKINTHALAVVAEVCTNINMIKSSIFKDPFDSIKNSIFLMCKLNYRKPSIVCGSSKSYLARTKTISTK
jgi:hypothetical protein